MMAIYVNKETRVLVQGITGNQGRFHTELMQNYGTNIVAGVTPGRAGQEVLGVPVYDTVARAVAESGADTSVIFVPAPFARDAVLEALEHLSQVIVVTEGIPVQDTMELAAVAASRGCRLLGPNTAGVISPGLSKVGIMPGRVFTPGKVGVISRSGTLAYEISLALTEAGYGQSSLVGIGGDRVIGTSFIDVLKEFEEDPETEAVVIIGEIGGQAEEEAAEYIKEMTKPVAGYIAGRTAPEGKRMGHAGAIISGGTGTAESKIKALEGAGAGVARIPTAIPEIIAELI